MAICLEQGAHLHMAQLMLLPLTVSCFSKIQIGFTFLVPAHPGSSGKKGRVCVCVVKVASCVVGLLLCCSINLSVDLLGNKGPEATYRSQYTIYSSYSERQRIQYMLA